MSQLGKQGIWYPIDRLDGDEIKFSERSKTSAIRRSGTQKRSDLNPLNSELQASEHDKSHHRQLHRKYLRTRPCHRQTRHAHLVQPLR